MKSMTGYGRAVAEADGNRATVEVSAVNSRKQVDMRFNLPRELYGLEPTLRQRIQQQLSRGSLQVAVSYKLDERQSQLQAAVDMPAALAVSHLLQELAAQGGLAAPTIQDVLAFPGVVTESTSSMLEPLQKLVLQALDGALANLDAMREQEGEALRDDLLRRGELIAELLQRVASRSQDALVLQRQRLLERIAALGVELTLDDERLIREVTFYAERADITEEIVRLQSHLQQFAQLLQNEPTPGRNLDFLGQEMSREANTMAAKTSDLEIAREVLEIKTELSRIREQVMNVE